MDGGRVLEVVEAVLATRFKVIMTSIADLKFVKKIRDHSFWGKEITQKNVFFVTFANSQQKCVKGFQWD